MPNKFNGYDVADYQSFTDAAEPPPNFQSMNVDDGLARLANLYTLEAVPFVRRVMLPDGSIHAARYFFNHTQGRKLDGSGFVLWHDNTADAAEGPRGHVAAFAICLHEKVAGRGANPSRGWLPGECSKCGLDMTVDSSG